mmetsp:Transcript_3914/g.9994  ORF Transcript_3914/g.9994 Transcript_3914/m.9994 type:complete len:458 (+) Transcript_3914:139-1512(+)
MASFSSGACPSRSISRSTSSVSTVSTDDEAELCEDGLHSIRRGTKLGRRYEVKGKLGTGHFSTVWLCEDIRDGGEVALKVYKSAERFQEFARHEVRLLRFVADKCQSTAQDVRVGGHSMTSATKGNCPGVVKILGDFLHDGPHCRHPCIALEVMGPTVLDISRQCRGDILPFHVLRLAARDVLRGLDFLHRTCNIIHTDVKPENVLVRLLKPSHDGAPPRSKRSRVPAPSCARWRRSLAYRTLRVAQTNGFGSDGGAPVHFGLADLGNGCFADKQVSDFIQTCEYRAPEVLLGAGYGKKTDLWSLGCTLFECATGRYLLDPRCEQRRTCQPRAQGTGAAELKQDAAALQEEVALRQEHLGQIVELLGILPDALVRRGKLSHHFFHEDEARGWVLRGTECALADVVRTDLRSRLRERLGEGSDVDAFRAVLELMLVAEPIDRAAAHEILEASDWFRRP